MLAVVPSAPGAVFGVLGELTVIGADGAVVPVAGQLPRSLLALLLTSSERVSASRVLDELWGREPPASGSRALQVSVSRLRRQLAGVDGVTVTGNRLGYLIDRPDARLDSHEFESGLARLTPAADPAGAVTALRAALSWWRGEALREFGHVPALAAEAARLDDLRIGALERLARALIAGSESAEARRVIAPVVSANPLWEGSRTTLMRALYLDGRQSEALDQYIAAVGALDAVGLVPSRELRQLQEAILRHDPALSSDVGFGQSSTEVRHRSNPGLRSA
jgi:DNA-binding SARP family transcriptional activator